jgi:hypothetical protein
MSAAGPPQGAHAPPLGRPKAGRERLPMVPLPWRGEAPAQRAATGEVTQ